MIERLLEAWFRPLDFETFRDEYLSRRVVFREAVRARLDEVASLSSWNVDELLASPGAKPLGWFQADDGRHLTADLAPESAGKLYRAGTTLYLKEVAPIVPIGDAIARELKVPRHRIQCALFCNRPGARTRAHFDPVDTFTLQLKGHKRWRLAPNELVSDPTTGWATLDGAAKKADLWLYAHDELPSAMPANVDEYLLEPGAVLNVPRGFWHETESGEESVSLHVHHAALPWVDTVLVSLRSLLLRDPAWREGADRLWDTTRAEPNAQTVERLLGSLVTAAGRLSADDVLPAVRPPERSPGPRTPMFRRARAGFVVEQHDRGAQTARVTFTMVDYGSERRTTAEMSDAYLAACRLFAESPEGGPFSAAELAARVPELSLDEASQLVGLLLDIGFLRPA